MASRKSEQTAERSTFGRVVSVINTLTWLLVLGSLVMVLLGLLNFRSAYFDVRDDMHTLVETDVTDSQATRIYARDYDPATGEGTLLGIAAEENRKDVDFYELPPMLVACLLSTEDHRFYRHRGVDILGTGRAVMRGVSSNSDIRGTSTITQQLARNVYLANIKSEKSLNRKAQEAVLAMELEQQLTKNEIIERYLNHVYLGNHSYGVKAAAENYFGKDLNELSLAECALLAGLPQQPSAYNPADPDKQKRAKERRDTVLNLLDSRLDEGFLEELAAEDPKMFGSMEITHAVVQEALKAPIEVNVKRGSNRLRYPYFTTYVIDNVLEERYKRENVRREGMTVVTTLDPQYQSWAEQIVKEKVDSQRKNKKVSQAVLMLLDAKTGEVLANVGGYEWGAPNRFGEPDSFNRGFLMRRQVGSSFKPFTYATAYEQGISPSALIWDGPNKEISAQMHREWPKNSDGNYLGWLSVARALQGSRNAAAVDLIHNFCGEESVINTCRKLGIEAELEPVPAMTLGVHDIQPIEMAEAYTVFPNMGTHIQHEVIRQVYNQNGFKIEDNVSPGAIQRRSNEALTQNTAWTMVNNMMLVVNAGTGTRAKLKSYEVGGKTGTCDDYRDAWFVGYTPELICAVWVGNDDHAVAMNTMFGGHLPAEIWHDFMVKILTPVEEKRDENGNLIHSAYTPRYTQKEFVKPEGAIFNGFAGLSGGSKLIKTEEGEWMTEEEQKQAEEQKKQAEQQGNGLPDEFYTPWEPGQDLGGSIF
ncbi:PBP1A family penicillin-binding protein [bacterium]|nr:PBP1A family penicillin-binding protein [bacterium]